MATEDHNPEHHHEHGHNDPLPDRWSHGDLVVAFLGMSASILLIIAACLQFFGPVPWTH